MSALLRLGLIVVAVLVVIGIVVVALSLAGEGTGIADRLASVEASAAPSLAASETPVPSAVDEDELLAVLAEIEDEVIAIRGLPRAEIGPPDIITRAELATELEQILDEDYPPADRERDNFALRALGLLGPDEDVGALQLELLRGGVLGFYDDTDRRMVVVSDAGLDALAKVTYAHEYTHALQDAAYDLDSLETDAPGEDDRGLARTSLIEGDASIVMYAWAFANLSTDELVEVGLGTEVPDLSGIPSWMVSQLDFPYSVGLNWASVLVGDPFDPDFAAIDAAFADPPDSTEQIIDPAKWNSRETPVSIASFDLPGALGSDWEAVDSFTVGEATIGMMLEYFGTTPDTANGAASGWGGDRCVVARGPGDEFAVAWRLSWDTSADASEFADAYRDRVGSLPFAATVVELSGGQVLVAHASSDALLRTAVDAADD